MRPARRLQKRVTALQFKRGMLRGMLLGRTSPDWRILQHINRDIWWWIVNVWSDTR